MALGFGNLTETRLKLLLGLLFVGLAVPASLLVLQALRQSEFETFYRYRWDAAAFSQTLDSRLGEAVRDLEQRDIDEYSFFVAGSDRRSPLSALELSGSLPGTLGYFRLLPDGRLTSPLLPDTPEDRSRAGLNAEDYSLRSVRFLEIQRAFQSSRFSRSVSLGERFAPASGTAAPPAGPADFTSIRERQAPARAARREAEVSADVIADLMTQDSPASAAIEGLTSSNADQASALTAEQSLGKLSDLDLDESLQQKGEQRLAEENRLKPMADSLSNVSAPALEEASLEVAERSASLAAAAAVETFATDNEPIRFGLLGPNRAALVRNVWIGDERHVVGILLDLDAFLDTGIVAAFERSSLYAVSSLAIAIEEDILRISGNVVADQYPSAVGSLSGSLLYTGQLTVPLDALKLVFSVTELPASPATALVVWTSAALAIVLGVGFVALYRLGSTQIRLARQQQDFVAAVSHELKTPLTSIRMYGEMLQSGWVDAEKRQSYYAYIHEESERLSRLIDNVLQLARISRQGVKFDLETVAVAELADLSRSKLQEPASRAGVDLVMTTDDSVAGKSVIVDKDCFLQIAINLIDNALKFATGSDPARIEYRFSEQGDGLLCLSIRDYGPGIPRSQLKRIFELFYRPNSELTRETVGTGIGLAIVSTLAQGMGGEVNARNRDPGAEFQVTFRLAAESDQAARPD